MPGPTARLPQRLSVMLLAHRIRLDPTPAQRDYFSRAAGTARHVWNWALAEWQRQVAAGQHPNAMALKKQFNAIKYTHPDWLDADGQPWLRTIHRDAHAQPFANLGKAWNRYFTALREKKPAHRPVFKKKGRCRDSFYVANDKLRLDDKSVVLPKIGQVALSEPLRWPGRIMGASVSREADRWFLSVQVDVPEEAARLRRRGNDVTGVDLGVSAAATFSSGEKFAPPRPLKAALRRLRIRGRRQSRKLKAAKAVAGVPCPIPKGTRLPVSANRTKGALGLARLHARIARAQGFPAQADNSSLPQKPNGRDRGFEREGHAGKRAIGTCDCRCRFLRIPPSAPVQGAAFRHHRGAGRPLVPVEQTMFTLWHALWRARTG